MTLLTTASTVIVMTEKVAWTVKEWAGLVSLSRPYVHILIKQNTIDSVKAGSRRLITTPPEEYLARLVEQTRERTYTKRGRPVKVVAAPPWVLNR